MRLLRKWVVYTSVFPSEYAMQDKKYFKKSSNTHKNFSKKNQVTNEPSSFRKRDRNTGDIVIGLQSYGSKTVMLDCNAEVR